MTNIPELTDDEAIAAKFSLLVARLGHSAVASFCEALASRVTILNADGIADEGHAALAAYDAKKRSAIRVEAMRECEAVATETLTYLAMTEGSFKALDSVSNIRRAIREKIAKEPTNG